MTLDDTTELRASKLVLVFADLAGFAKAFAHHDDEAMARFVDRLYRASNNIIGDNGGRVVKFIGDACHAVFAGDRGGDAIKAVLALKREVARLAIESQIAVELGASVHCGVVIEGKYGSPTDPQYDVIGAAMNYTAMMGRGPGIRISEPIYRQLENEHRARWQRVEPPVTYHYQEE